ncbi:MAG TPA: lyase family protein, partial [Roseiflexaceae bacterium]|nr:lyase family protein [Roseiflexaceae bacterium]
EAAVGAIPATAVNEIAEACKAERYNIALLAETAIPTGNIATAVVTALTNEVARRNPQVAGFVHWGATSQDAIDSALMLQIRAGLDLLIGDLLGVCARCAELAQLHRRTVMAGRTLLQQALPITFGLKAARWLALACRQASALRELRSGALALQFGGAAGTLAALGGNGMRVAELLAEELKLPLPDLAWHAERDRVARFATGLGVTAGAIAKIAGDIVLLAQTEVAEASEAGAPGRGGSSAMPHKRNPVDATLALAAARLAIGEIPVVLAAMPQEHERAAGGWQTEWAAIPRLFRATAGALARVRSALEGLQIDAERMRANLDLGGGLLMAEALMVALAPQIGRPEAQRLIQSLASRVHPGVSFRQALLEDAQVAALLSADEIDRALDPAAYLGSADALIDRALDSYRGMLSQ